MKNKLKKCKNTVKAEIKDLIEMISKFKDKLHESIKKGFSDYVEKLESEKSVVRDILKKKRMIKKKKLKQKRQFKN